MEVLEQHPTFGVFLRKRVPKPTKITRLLEQRSGSKQAQLFFWCVDDIVDRLVSGFVKSQSLANCAADGANDLLYTILDSWRAFEICRYLNSLHIIQFGGCIGGGYGMGRPPDIMERLAMCSMLRRSCSWWMARPLR